jgi:hypothetical protein
VVGTRLSFSPTMYAPLVLLRTSLLLRTAVDLGGSLVVRQWGGLFNAAVLLLFLANSACVVHNRSMLEANKDATAHSLVH